MTDIVDLVVFHIAKNMAPTYTDAKPGFSLTVLPPIILQGTKPWVFF